MLSNLNHDYLDKWKDFIEADHLNPILLDRDLWLTRDSVKEYSEILDKTPSIQTNHFKIKDGWVEIGTPDEITPIERENLVQCLLSLAPWRKGPFRLFGIEVDAEWRSDWKWERLAGKVDSLKHKKICDIGCNNGYYLFQMLSQEPAFLLGIDPIPKLFFQYQIFRKYLKAPQIYFEYLGVEQLMHFKKLFDVVFCMGILYHRKNPLETLMHIRESMAPNGQLIIESAGIPGEESIALFPESSYGKAKNIFFMPTVACMKSWLLKSGFKEVEVIYAGALTFEEQRKTEWCQYQTLEDFTSADDHTKTIEGYPSPIRMILTARTPLENKTSRSDIV